KLSRPSRGRRDQRRAVSRWIQLPTPHPLAEVFIAPNPDGPRRSKSARHRLKSAFFTDDELSSSRNDGVIHASIAAEAPFPADWIELHSLYANHVQSGYFQRAAQFGRRDQP